MQQKLIVEGKSDAFVIAMLLKGRNNKPPLGYSDLDKYKSDFVKVAGSIDKVKNILIEQLDSPDVEKIGIVVDANGNEVQKRIDLINGIVAAYKLQKNQDDDLTWTSSEEGNELKVSLWVMPNNKSEGYLEHFLYGIIPNKYNIAKEHASKLVEEFYAKDDVDLPNVKKQKAKTHAYLSLMENPGLPFGTAIEATYFDARHENVDAFEDWFKHIFVLEED